MRRSEVSGSQHTPERGAPAAGPLHQPQMLSSSMVDYSMFSRMVAIALLLAASASSVLSTGADARLADRFFKGKQILTFRIRVEEEELTSLREQPRKYVRCTITENGRCFENVGIRFKGKTSF